MVRVGLLVRFDAVPGKEEEVARFLEGALPLVNDEPATLVWHAIRLGSSTFGIFDALPDEAGREAHLSGKVAEALLGSVGELVQQPTIEQVDVLASKTPGQGAQRPGSTTGLRASPPDGRRNAAPRSSSPIVAPASARQSTAPLASSSSARSTSARLWWNAPRTSSSS